MLGRTPLETVELLDEAFNRRDLEAILDFYEDEAAMVVEPGRVVTGKPELRRTYEWILTNLNGVATQEKTDVIETGNIALFTSRWSFKGAMPDGTSASRVSFASVILRKQADGGWRIVVDNSWGPAVLG